MTQQHHQNHATWECKYHVVFIPKDRKKAIFGSTVGRDEEMIRAYIKEPRDAGSRTGSALNDPIVPSQK